MKHQKEHNKSETKYSNKPEIDVRKLREKRKKTVQAKTAANLGDRSTGSSPCTPLSKSPSVFPNMMARKGALKKTTESLPKTLEKKAELLEKIVSSPRTRDVLVAKGLIQTPDEEKEVSAITAMAADISEGVEHMKKSSSKNNRAAYTTFKFVAFSENVAKSRAKQVIVNAKHMKEGLGKRSKILTRKRKRKSWFYTERNTRGDAIREDIKQLIFNENHFVNFTGATFALVTHV